MKKKTATKKTARKRAAKKTGRPSKFNGLDLKKVEAVARRGWTDREMAEFFEVDPATWWRWKGQAPEFCKALKEWKQEADERVERTLYERACGYAVKEDKIFLHEGEPVVVPTIKQYPPETTACIFWLKNRRPQQWRDKVEMQHDGKLEVSINIPNAKK